MGEFAGFVMVVFLVFAVGLLVEADTSRLTGRSSRGADDRFHFTPEGHQDYRRALAEIYVQRLDKASRYYGVHRIHCHDGYVDVRGTCTNPDPHLKIAAAYGIAPGAVNGATVDQSVETFLAWCDAHHVERYDVWRR